ncbi:hypothetical protein NMG60_11002592 [Bertholletia excelsa]
MSTEKRTVAVQDLAEEAKKRIVFLIICVVGLSYLMSLTSSSVWINLPAAACLIIIIRYFSLDFEMRRKAVTYKGKTTSANFSSPEKPFENPKSVVEKSDWRRKVNSPAVENALDQFTRHLVSEWVTDLWYCRITPDREGPEELVQIMNGVLGEISYRLRNVNLIDLLTRDIIDIFCSNLELFRACHAKVEKQQLQSLTCERRDMGLKAVLAAKNKLHPALFSAEAEHKVLQLLMEGLISLTVRPADLQCSAFRFIVRELLACAVMRPVLNLANPRFVNERIESLVIFLNKDNKRATTAQAASPLKMNGSPRISPHHFSLFPDPTVKGVELVPIKKDQSKTEEKSTAENVNATLLSKDPLLSMDTRSTLSWSALPTDFNAGDARVIQQQRSAGEWGDMLDIISRRKTEALAPEHLENMWAKGRNYKRKEGGNQVIEPKAKGSLASSKRVDDSTALSREKEKDGPTMASPKCSSILSTCNNHPVAEKLLDHEVRNLASQASATTYSENDEDNQVETGSSSYTSEDEETSNITGLDSPGTRVWVGKNNRNICVSHIHHPLESSKRHKAKKFDKANVRSRVHKTNLESKRSRLSNHKVHTWEELERTSFLSGDGQDILNSAEAHMKSDESSDDYEAEMLGRIQSGATASSSVPSTSIPGSQALPGTTHKNSPLADCFLKLRCEVLGANIVRSGSITFAVYAISVTDINGNSWSIKRRFRHFEELHRRLKEFPEYNLHLPPKHFLSTGLDVPVILERCKLLDQYLKRLLQLPTISGSIEVWDFLSVDSQTYTFSDSISIIETLSVNLADAPHERSNKVQNALGSDVNSFPSWMEQQNDESKEATSPEKHNFVGDRSRLNPKGEVYSPPKRLEKELGKRFENLGGFGDTVDQKNIFPNRKFTRGNEEHTPASSQPVDNAATDPTLPAEWIPPSLSIPVLDLVDVIFQLHDGGWIRRKVFWLAKQVLHLGMGDAFDDWLIDKIQLLRKGSVVASGIRRIEQILWPDGIFITKHPKRRRPNPPGGTPKISTHCQPPTPFSSPKKEEMNKLDENQQREAERRAKFVYELMIDNAPAAIVGVVGRKEYEKCAKDLYYFLQSSVCLKQLAYDLLELLLLSAFPEMDSVLRKLHEEKDAIGEFRPA